MSGTVNPSIKINPTSVNGSKATIIVQNYSVWLKTDLLRLDC